MLQAATWKIFSTFCVAQDYTVFFLYGPLPSLFKSLQKKKKYSHPKSLPLAGLPSEHKDEYSYKVYSSISCHFLCQCLQCLTNYIAITHI